jgi:hypothetical protein
MIHDPDAATAGALSAGGAVSGLRDPLADHGQSSLLDLSAEGGGSASAVAVPAIDGPVWYRFVMTEAEVKLAASGILPDRIRLECEEALPWLAGDVEEALRGRARSQKSASQCVGSQPRLVRRKQR